jgi:hypothetical protein
MQPVYHLVYLVFPKPTHPEYGELDGAYASCWVKDPVLERADRAARTFIGESSWDIEAQGEVHEVSPESCPPGAEGREHFEKAQLDGLACVFYAWPLSPA